MEFLKDIEEINKLITSKIDFKQFILFINKEYEDLIKIDLNPDFEIISTNNFPDKNYIGILVDKDVFNFDLKEVYTDVEFRRKSDETIYGRVPF